MTDHTGHAMTNNDTPHPARSPAHSPTLYPHILAAWAQSGTHHHIPISGCSMLPTLRDGDVVLVSHGSAGVRRGDILVFCYREPTPACPPGDSLTRPLAHSLTRSLTESPPPHLLIAHRVLRVRPGPSGPTFLTKGDNVSSFDPPPRATEIIGRVVAIERDDQTISLDTPAWRALGWSPMRCRRAASPTTMARSGSG